MVYCTVGAIELMIFSEHFSTELDVVDIQTQRIDRFGEITATALVVCQLVL